MQSEVQKIMDLETWQNAVRNKKRWDKVLKYLRKYIMKQKCEVQKMNTGIYEHLFEYYPANEHIELNAYQGALIARETLPYTKLLEEKDIFGV